MSATIRTKLSESISAALQGAGLTVLRSDFVGSCIRVDIKGKPDATTAKGLLEAAGLRNVRALNEGRGVWIVVGSVATA